MLDLDRLQQLVAVAEHGSLSAAAQALHLSQPALSRSMQHLEEALEVSLFIRTKNKLVLNEAGLLAVEQARAVLSAAEAMQSRLRDYDRSQRSIAIGSCAPGPMWLAAPSLIRDFPEKAITSEMHPTEALLSGLSEGRYQLIVVDRPVKEPGMLCREYLTERLFVSLPPAHPLAREEGLYLSDLAGQTMLLYSDLGVWERLRREKMGGIRFIVQKDREAFSDLINASFLPSFSSDLMRTISPPPLDRVEVPVLDEEAAITFYICAAGRDRSLLESLSVKSGG